MKKILRTHGFSIFPNYRAQSDRENCSREKFPLEFVPKPNKIATQKQKTKKKQLGMNWLDQFVRHSYNAASFESAYSFNFFTTKEQVHVGD